MASVVQPDSEGNTPLHHAARSGNMRRIKACLSAGHDLNAKNKAGLTPLAVATEHGCHEAVIELLRAQAKPADGLP